MSLTELIEMKTLTFIAITLASGAIAGTILGIINQGIVEPFLDKAIELETQKKMSAGEIIDPNEVAQYRIWQKGGGILAGTILGLSFGALVGIVFAYGRSILPGKDNKRKALILVGIMWLVLFLVPALKYPGNPPSVGDPGTIYYRQSIYVGFLLVSGVTTLGLALANRRIRAPFNKIALPAVYAAAMAAAYLAFPSNPDEITAPMDLVINFRIASAFTMSVMWGLIGVTLGALWERFKPHETTNLRMV